MTPALLNLILWAPFLLVFLFAGLIFCISGYKKGLWRALISLGVTVVSAILSLILANVIAKSITPSVSGMIDIDSMLGDLPISASAVQEIVLGLIGSILSLVLFVILMFILTLILKLVSNAIKRQALIRTEKGYKLGGLGVRFVDAILYTVLLLLPLYGSIQAYVPTVQTLLSFVEVEGAEEIKGYVDVLAAHPTVLLTKPSPIAAIYKGLQNFEVNDSVVNIPEIVETAGKTVEMLDELSKKDLTQLDKDDLEIIDHLRDNVVSEDWFYAIADESIKALKDEIELDPEDEYSQMLLSLLDMDKESFSKNCTALLDIVELLIKHDLIAMLQGDDIDVVKLYESGCIADALRIVNDNDQLLAIKTMVIKNAIAEMYDEQPEKATAFLKTLKLEKLTTDAQLKAEVDAIGILIMNQNSGSVLEVIKRHPMFTDATLDMILADFTLSDILGFGGTLGEYIDTPEVTQKLLTLLEDCSDNAFNELHFGDYAAAIEAVDAYYSDEYYSYDGDVFTKGGEAMEYALELLKGYIKSNYQDMGISAFKENILKSAINSANEKAFASGENYIYILDTLNTFINAIWERSINLDMIPKDPTDEELSYLNTILSSDKGCAMLKQMCASKSDPLSLNLDPQQKSFVNKAIEALKAKYDEYEKLAEARKALDEAIARGEEIRSEISDGKVRYYDSKGNLLYESELEFSIGGGDLTVGSGDSNIKFEEYIGSGDSNNEYTYNSGNDFVFSSGEGGFITVGGSFDGDYTINGSIIAITGGFNRPQNLDANIQSLLKFLGI